MQDLLEIKRSRRQFLGYSLLVSGSILTASVANAFGSKIDVIANLQQKLSVFSKTIEGKLFLRTHADFDGMRRAGSFNPSTDKRPAVIVQCKSAEDVAKSVNFARDNELELAVKSGGHDILGKCTCEGGVMIDTSLMQDLEVDSPKRTLRVGAGVRVGSIEYKLSETGLALPMTCHPGVGISGCTLGGGLGWLLGKYGTTADSVTKMTVVSADGRTIQASKSQNDDLFWALRGGGGNFGVVTEFEYDAHPQDEVIGGFIVYPIDALGEYLQFYREIMATAPDELMIEISTTQTNPPLLVTSVCYSGTLKASKAVLAPIRNFGKPLFDGIHQTKLSQIGIPSKEALDLIADYSKNIPKSAHKPDGYYNSWRGESMPKWTDSAIETFVKGIEDAPQGWSMGIGHYMHGAATNVDRNATALIREQDSSSFFMSLSWGHSSESKDSMAWVDEKMGHMKPYNDKGVYVNYLSSNEASDVAKAYGDNYSRLQSLKSKYDPKNLFHLNRNIRT